MRHDTSLCHGNICACNCDKCSPECAALKERQDRMVSGGRFERRRRDTMMRKGKARTK